MRQQKVSSLAEAAEIIEDGMTVALGGHTLRRHPMALVHGIIRKGCKNLRLLGWNNGIDMDMLIGAGCVSSIETSYVGMGMFGLARNYRRYAESGLITVLEHSETTAIDMFRAGSMGLSFFPSKTPLGTDMPRTNPHMKEVECPFTGEKYAAIQAVMADVALVHAHYADRYGNVQLRERSWMDTSVDIIMAKAARRVIVSVEQIVSDEAVLANPRRTVIPSCFVDYVVEAPYGAHPCCCDNWYDYDVGHLELYYAASKAEETYAAYLREYITGTSDHLDYLGRVGIGDLLQIRVRGEAA